MATGSPDGDAGERPDEHARPPASPPVVVDGVSVHSPLTEPQARVILPFGLLADDPDGLLAAWSRVEEMWNATTDRALQLPAEALSERVNGEWSFLETLRHLVMVTDGWVRRTVLDVESPFHPLGVPPHFIDGAELGLDLDATPDAEVVLAVRRDRMAQVREAIIGSTPEDLVAVVTRGARPWTTLGALQVVIFEEWAHHQYATRDLATLER